MQDLFWLVVWILRWQQKEAFGLLLVKSVRLPLRHAFLLHFVLEPGKFLDIFVERLEHLVTLTEHLKVLGLQSDVPNRVEQNFELMCIASFEKIKPNYMIQWGSDGLYQSFKFELVIFAEPAFWVFLGENSIKNKTKLNHEALLEPNIQSLVCLMLDKLRKMFQDEASYAETQSRCFGELHAPTLLGARSRYHVEYFKK